MDAAELEMFQRRRALAKQARTVERGERVGERERGRENRCCRIASRSRRRRGVVYLPDCRESQRQRQRKRKSLCMREQVLPHRFAPPTAEGVVYVPDWNRDTAGSLARDGDLPPAPPRVRRAHAPAIAGEGQ
jgi:hypothetical protein